jgi:hypothetical protein
MARHRPAAYPMRAAVAVCTGRRKKNSIRLVRKVPLCDPILDWCRVDFVRHRTVPHIGLIGDSKRIAAQLPPDVGSARELAQPKEMQHPTTHDIDHFVLHSLLHQIFTSFSLQVLDLSPDSSLASNTHKLVLMFLHLKQASKQKQRKDLYICTDQMDDFIIMKLWRPGRRWARRRGAAPRRPCPRRRQG